MALVGGGGLGLGVRQRADADVADGAGGAPGGDAERPAQVALGADGNPLALRLQVHHLLVVDPGLNFGNGDADAHTVPAIGLELLDAAGLVLRGVGTVDARQANDAAAPAAD